MKIHSELQHFNVGPFKVKQPLPNSLVNGLSPFLLLHHAGPSFHAPGSINTRLSPHPHRGFEPVTFLFSGGLHHKDSTGAEGWLYSGDVQWMTAGRGIIHSEGPSEAFAETGGTMELIQLWVNLPRNHKMSAPRYQDLKADKIPVVTANGFSTKVVAGNYASVAGPAETFTPIDAFMVEFKAGGAAAYTIPQFFNGIIYVLNGSVLLDGSKIDGLEMAVFEGTGRTIELEALSDGKLLFLSGAPIEEPVVSYGPFVMNYQGEIKQAMLDYETGKMGKLDF